MLFYIYHIHWSKNNMHYYGVRGTNIDPQNDLWVKYFTSSKYVKQYRKEHGEPDIIEVRKVFDDREKALLWEQNVLIRVGARKSKNWLNRYDGKYAGAPGPKNHGHKISKTTSGKLKSQDHRKNLSLSITGSFSWFTNGDENVQVKRNKIKDFLQKNKNFYSGKTVSLETRKKQSESRLIAFDEGRLKPIHKDHVGNKNPMFGKKQNDETRKIISQKAKERMKDTSKRLYGEKNPMFGKKHTDEVKQASSERVSNLRWYTNEEINIYIHKDAKPPEGFRKGKKKTNRRTRQEMLMPKTPNAK